MPRERNPEPPRHDRRGGAPGTGPCWRLTVRARRGRGAALDGLAPGAAGGIARRPWRAHPFSSFPTSPSPSAATRSSTALSLAVQEGDRIALVGRNGVGQVHPDEGHGGPRGARPGPARHRAGIRVGYMEQDPDLSGFATLGDYATADLPPARTTASTHGRRGAGLRPRRDTATASRRRAPPRRAGAPPGRGARPHAPRRAHEPPRHRRDLLAGGAARRDRGRPSSSSPTTAPCCAT